MMEIFLMQLLAAGLGALSTAWAGPSGFGGGPTRFSRKLDQALQLALQRAAQGG